MYPNSILMTQSKYLPGAPHVHYEADQLMLEGVSLNELAKAHGTPLFVYSKASMLSALKSYQDGFVGRQARVHYAMKANSSLAILQLFARHGCGFDIVSIGELERVKAIGADMGLVIFSGVGKTRAEIRQALQEGILCFNVESVAELDVINEVALELSKKAAISVRVNPNVDAQTHPYISTGLKGTKFGVAHEDTLRLYQHAQTLQGIEIKGIDCHIGSQITQVGPYLDAMNKVLDLVEVIEDLGVYLSHIDFGGGLGIQYEGEHPPSAQDMWGELFKVLDQRGYGQRQIIVEPGRSLVGNAGVCISQVQYLKPGEQKNFCIIDAAMNDVPRPAMYEAFHEIVPLLAHQSSPMAVYDVVGPICESGDWLGRERSLNVQVGEHLAILSAGAYCMSMSSNYNTRGRAAEVLVDGNSSHLIRRRENTQDLLQFERLLD
jgi:diaminopimelate decarboxylase